MSRIQNNNFTTGNQKDERKNSEFSAEEKTEVRDWNIETQKRRSLIKPTDKREIKMIQQRAEKESLTMMIGGKLKWLIEIPENKNFRQKVWELILESEIIKR